MKDCHSQAVLEGIPSKSLVLYGHCRGIPGIAGNFEIRLQTEFSMKRGEFLTNVGAVSREEFAFQECLGKTSSTEDEYGNKITYLNKELSIKGPRGGIKWSALRKFRD